MLDETIFRVVDTETTGLDEGAEVVELAYEDLIPGAAPSEGERFQSLYRPSHPIPAEVRAIHHITDAMVAQRPSFDADLLRIDAWDLNMVLVAHNAPFDAWVTGTQDLPWLCTRRLAMHLFPDAPKHSNQVLRYYLPDQGYDLRLPDMNGLMPHRAMADVHVTYALLEVMLEIADRMGFADAAELIAYADEPVELKTVTFGKHAGMPWDEVPDSYLTWMADKEFDKDIAHTRDCQIARRMAK